MSSGEVSGDLVRAGFVEDSGQGYAALVLADQDGGSLEIQRSRSADDQDVALVMDTYCLSVNGGAATCYGGVADWAVTGNVLRLRLTAEAATVLGLPESLVIAVVPGDVAIVSAQLPRLVR